MSSAVMTASLVPVEVKAVQLRTFAELSGTVVPGDAIAHGYLADGPVALFACDEAAFRCEGKMLPLLGTAPASTQCKWFSSPADGVVDDLRMRPWGASDGQVIDRYGLHWLIGFEREDSH